MNRFARFTIVVTFLSALSLGALVLTAQKHTPPIIDVLPGLLIFLILNILSEALSLPLRGAKAVTSISFVLHLAAIPLFGPLWASTQAALAEVAVEIWIRKRRDPLLALFNTAQLFLTVSLGGLCYAAIAETPGLITSPRVIFAFALLLAVYFLTNSLTVCTAVALRRREPFTQIWRELAASTILYDVVAAPLAYFVSLLYTRAGLSAAVLILLFVLYLRRIYQQHLKLQQLNQDLLRIIVKTIEAKDPYTSGHSLRVARVSRQIGLVLELSHKRLEQLENAALFHDIGKIDLAYHDVIQNPRTLTDDEKAIIRSHPTRGAELLASIESLDPAIVEAVRHHHEFYDGTGYPAGLSGNQIPLFARVIMLADSIDAMASARAYRGPLPRDIILAELRNHTGRQFDPEITRQILQSNILDIALELARGAEVQTQEAPRRMRDQAVKEASAHIS